MQAENLIAGEWYHTVECSKCGSDVHAFHARHGAEERMPGPGLYAVRCNMCGYRDLYKPNAFLAQQAGAPRVVERRVEATQAYRRRSGVDRRRTASWKAASAQRTEARRPYVH